MTATDFDYITAVFLHYLQPIADLCERMLDQCSGEPNEVQTSARENGYALSIISLTAFFFEGACGRARYFNGLAAVGIPALANQKGWRWTAADTLCEFNEIDLAERIEDIFVVRHAIAHAHLWKATVDEIDLRFTERPTRLPGYGDKNFDKVVDPVSRTTRLLGLDVFPPRIHAGTAITVLKECVEALESLESKHKEFFLPLVHQQIRFRSKFVRFYKWVRELP